MQQNFFLTYMSVHTLVLVGGGENVDMVVATLVWIYCMCIATKPTTSTLIIYREEVFVGNIYSRLSAGGSENWDNSLKLECT